MSILYIFILPCLTCLNSSNNIWPKSRSLDSTKHDNFPSILFNSISNREQNQQNIVISPFSIESALTLLYMGAEGDTAKEFQKVLHYNTSNKTETATNYSKIMKSMSSNNDIMQINSANRIYTRFDLVPEFNKIALKYFQAEAEKVDFKLNEQTAQKINNWVEENTNNKITNLVSPSSIDDATTAMLVNAIYFKAQWTDQFSTRATKKRTFHMSKNKTTEVDTMFGEITCKYAEFPEFDATAIELKYESTDMVMDVILPNKHDGLDELERSLSVTNLGKMFENITEELVEVKLPKFRIEFDTNLISILRDLGMKKSFEYGANFKGIFDTIRPIKISDIIHKAFIEVNEFGSEAAAATYTKVVFLSAAHPAHSFTADHPFMFVIRNPQAVYFVGHVKKLEN